MAGFLAMSKEINLPNKEFLFQQRSSFFMSPVNSYLVIL